MPKCNDSRMIRNLVFDFGNVLLASDFDHYLDRIISDETVKAKFREVVFDKKFTEKLDLGFSSSQELFDDLARQHPDLAPHIQVFSDRWMEHLNGEMPGMYDCLQRYREMGFRLYGLSNWSDMIYPVLERYPIFQLLDGAVISCEEHLVKPDAAIYLCLLEKFGLKAEECLFADDREENILAARKLGMQGIVFRNTSQFDEALSRVAETTSPIGRNRISI